MLWNNLLNCYLCKILWFLLIFRKLITFFLFISLMQEKRNQRVHYPQGPLQRGMQPLLLSLLHFGKLRPSKVWLGFIDYAKRWSII